MGCTEDIFIGSDLVVVSVVCVVVSSIHHLPQRRTVNKESLSY